MKWEGVKGTGLIALTVLSVGCASTGKQPLDRKTANELSGGVIQARTESEGEEHQGPQSLACRAYVNPPGVQLTSARQPVQPGAQRHDETGAGRQFTRPPAIPTAPPAIEANQELVPQGEALRLEVLEAMACQNNPTLLQAQSQIEGELGKAIQAGLWPNPKLSYVQEQIGVDGTLGEFVGGTISQRIVTGQKLELSRAKFLARTRAAEWHALEQQYRVLNDVRVHYFRARGHYELVQIHRELLKSAEDNVLTTREQFNVGQATRSQVHLANVALQRARLDLLRNENSYRQSFEALTALVGVDLPLAPLATSLEGDLTPVDYQDALLRLLSQSPQLQAARTKLESDRITIRRELVEPVPDIVVEAGVGRNFEADQTTAAARVGIELPVFDRNQGTIRQAEADFVRQQGEIRRLELILKQNLAHTYRDYLTALQHASNYQSVILPEARSAYELQLRSYKDARITWPEVLRTQEGYFMLRAEYIRNLIAWRENEILISGFLLQGGLMAPHGPPPPGHINAVPKPR